MTFEEKMAAIDRYFDNITSEEFNDLLERKYGITREDVPSVNEGDDFSESSNGPFCYQMTPLSFRWKSEDSDIESNFSDDYAKAA